MIRKKIKIIHIIPTLNMGGAERLMVDIVVGLDKEKFEPEVICISDGGYWRQELKENNIFTMILKKKKGFNPLVFLRLYKILKERNPDIVHTHLFGADFYGKICAKLAGVKTIISTEHNLNFSESFWRIAIKKFLARLSTEIIAVSEAVKNYAITSEGASINKISVIYNGIRLRRFLNENREYENKGYLKIGSIGRLTEQKGYEYLIEAVALVNSNKIICEIAGEGELKKYLEEKISKFNLEKQISLVGQVKNIPGFLDGLDLFVLSSRWEGLGIVILEAGASGLPVIASDVDGIKEIIKDKENGLLFPVGDVKELADKIKYLLQDSEERKRLGKSLQTEVRENYDIKKITEKYEEVYLKLIDKN